MSFARQYFYAESTAESTNATSTYNSQTTLTFTPTASSNYLLLWCATVYSGSTSNKVNVRLQNTTDAVTCANPQMTAAATTDYVNVGGIYQYTSTASPASHSFAIQFASNNGSTTVKIKEARLIAIKLDTLDQFAASDTTTAVNTNFTEQTIVSKTFTPATAGDYLIVGSVERQNDAGAGQDLVNSLVVDGAFFNEVDYEPSNTTDWSTFVAMRKVTFTAASHTVGVQQATSNSASHCRNARVVALRLDNFLDAFESQSDTTATSTAATDNVDGLTLTATANAGNHLVLFNALVNSTDVTNPIDVYGYDGTTLYNREEKTPENAVNYYPFFAFYQPNLTAGSKTWKIRYGSFAFAQANITGQVIAALRLDSPGTTATGVAGTGSAGTMAKTLAKTPAGVAATGSAGTMAKTVSRTPAGVAGTGAAGTMAKSMKVAITGVAGAGFPGPAPREIVAALITGAAGTGAVGAIQARGGAVATLVGVSGAGRAGAMTTTITVTASIIGVQGIGGAGAMTTTITLTTSIVGVQAVGVAGSLMSDGIIRKTHGVTTWTSTAKPGAIVWTRQSPQALPITWDSDLNWDAPGLIWDGSAQVNIWAPLATATATWTRQSPQALSITWDAGLQWDAPGLTWDGAAQTNIWVAQPVATATWTMQGLPTGNPPGQPGNVLIVPR